jgi:hypothetical protein
VCSHIHSAVKAHSPVTEFKVWEFYVDFIDGDIEMPSWLCIAAVLADKSDWPFLLYADSRTRGAQSEQFVFLAGFTSSFFHLDAFPSSLSIGVGPALRERSQPFGS